MTIEFCYLIFITADYYAIANFIIPRFLLRKKYVRFISSTFLIIAVSAWLRASLSIQINQYVFKQPLETGLDTLYLNSVLNISIWVLVITIGKMLIDRIQTQKLVEVLEKEKIKSELDYLKAQINPHALFNSLNTIYGHIEKNNQTARNTLLQFSELLRYQLYDCTEEKISLELEIGYIKNYIAFQRLRKDENLVVSFQAAPIETGLTIAPLLLVVLIENAFKFVSAYLERENKIIITIYTEGSLLYSSFVNTKEVQHSSTNKNTKGIGVANLKRRLQLLYPNNHELITKDEHEFYETSLTINLSCN